jgi:hypothetical protein
VSAHRVEKRREMFRHAMSAQEVDDFIVSLKAQIAAGTFKPED